MYAMPCLVVGWYMNNESFLLVRLRVRATYATDNGNHQSKERFMHESIELLHCELRTNTVLNKLCLLWARSVCVYTYIYIYTYMYFFMDMFIFTIRTRLLNICYVRWRVHATNAIDDDNNQTEVCFMLETFSLLNCFILNWGELHVHSCH